MKPRWLLAICGTLLLGVYGWSTWRLGFGGANQAFFAAVCARSGLILLATALAWPQLVLIGRRFPAWVWGVWLAVSLVVVAYPKLIFMALAVGSAVVAANAGFEWLRRQFGRKS